jgi:hypothetical protein
MKRLLAIFTVASLTAGCHYYFESDDDGDPPDPTGDGGVDPGNDGGVSATCSEPLPDPLPDPPDVPRDGTGLPLFASWQNIVPENTGDFYCNPIQGVECGPAAGNTDTCHVVDPATGDGFCTFFDADISCDGEGQLISFDNGRCWTCGPVASHAALCAQDVAGVDCRTYPFPGNGIAGEPCAVHEDCGAGLLCGAGAGDGYGICQCPESFGSNPAPPNSCFDGVQP